MVPSLMRQGQGGLFILAAARLFRMDIHTAAISSAANIGGAASAPVVISLFLALETA